MSELCSDERVTHIHTRILLKVNVGPNLKLVHFPAFDIILGFDYLSLLCSLQGCEADAPFSFRLEFPTQTILSLAYYLLECAHVSAFLPAW